MSKYSFNISDEDPNLKRKVRLSEIEALAEGVGIDFYAEEKYRWFLEQAI